MDDVGAAAFGAIVMFVLALWHHDAFRNPGQNVITRLIDQWYSRWYRTGDERHGVLGFLAAGYFLLSLFFIVVAVCEFFYRLDNT